MSDQKLLIDQLVGELKPVSPHWAPWKRALAFTALQIGILFFAFEFRLPLDWESALGRLEFGRFQWEVIAGLLVTLVMTYYGFLYSVPGGKDKQAKYRIIAASVFLLLAFFISFVPDWVTHTAHGGRHHCKHEVFFYSAASFVAFFLWARKSHYTKTPNSFLLAALGTSAMPVIFMQMFCVNIPMHALYYHYGPAFLVIASLCVLRPLFKKLL